MSIDLDWWKLDDILANTLVDLLNKQLLTTTRPSFIGPVEVTSLDFGSAAPDVELVDLCDIYRDFLEDDEDEQDEVAKDDEEGYEWVSRQATRRDEGFGHPSRYGDMFSSVPNMASHMDIWNGSGGTPGLPDFRQRPWATPVMGNSPKFTTTPMSTPSPPRRPSGPPRPPPVPQQQGQHPNLQTHLHINWQSNIRITLTTSLLINYPSPMFMSLPIKLCVTGLIFSGEVAVAYEGQRKRIHLCILDELDPYGPAGDRSKRESPANGTPDIADAIPPPPISRQSSKPLPIGQRLLPSIFIESEIGQADKHVLKNVTRVERFIQDVVRKTVEDELVFPNFHTMVLPGAE